MCQCISGALYQSVSNCLHIMAGQCYGPHLWAPGVIGVQAQPVGSAWAYPHPELFCRHVWHGHTHNQISAGQLLLGTAYLHRHDLRVKFA